MSRSALPTVTVVTPCFNAASTIERTLDSVRSQGYPATEHIVVDGGSTDGTVDILRGRPDVRYVSEPDRGLSDALNKGIALATGDIIGWLNADDTYLPGALDAVGRAMADHPDAAWATGRCPIVDATGREIRPLVTKYKNFFLRRYSFPLYLTQNFISCPATFVRLARYEEIGPFREDLRYSMDYDVFLRVAKLGDPIVLDRDLATFTMSEGTMSMSGFEHQFEEHYRVAREHGADHRVAVAVNAVVSRAIVVVYRLLRAVRTSFSGAR